MSEETKVIFYDADGDILNIASMDITSTVTVWKFTQDVMKQYRNILPIPDRTKHVVLKCRVYPDKKFAPINQEQYKDKPVLELLELGIVELRGSFLTVRLTEATEEENNQYKLFSWETVQDVELQEKKEKEEKEEKKSKQKEEYKELMPLFKKKLYKSNKTKNKSSWPWPRIAIGIIDLLLLVAAVTTFLLNMYIVITIVLVVLNAISTALFFGWHYILPKILPTSWWKKINLGTNLGGDNNELNKKLDEKEEEPLPG